MEDTIQVFDTFPLEDGFYMPGEFEPHHGCLMIWPERPGSWTYGAKGAREAFALIAEAVSQSEQVYMLVKEKDYDSARSMLPGTVSLIVMDSDDAWARDTGPTFVVDGKGGIRGIDWQFNAWGGEVDGLYEDWKSDDQVAEGFCRYLGVNFYNAKPFVLEGGSIHSDGQGTILVTEACLLSPGRNPLLTKGEIEERLKLYLGAKKVIWLPRGIYNDETNEHVDNVCAFVKPGHVVLAWTENKEDPQYELSMSCLEVLERERDAMGRTIQVTRLPIPHNPVCITQKDLDGFVFAPGEDQREAGERLAASYVNFYIANKSVIVPQFGDVMDQEAIRILSELFPTRSCVPIAAREIIVGGGNIHCITQQIPAFGPGENHI